MSLRLAISAGIVALVMILAQFGELFVPMDNRILDLRFRLRGNIDPHPDIQLMVVSDEDFREYGPWPLPNQLMGEYVDAITTFGARSIVLDAIFSRPTAGKGDAYLRKASQVSARVYFPLRFSPYQEAISLEDSSVSPRIIRHSLDQLQPGENILPMKGLQALLLPGLDTVAKSLGFVYVSPDEDGIVRRTPMLLSCNGMVFPHLGVQVWGRSARMDLRSLGISPYNLKIGKESQFPLDGKARLFINWPGNWDDIPKLTFGRIMRSYQAIKQGRTPEIPMDSLTQLKDKVVLLGTVDRSSYEFISTPMENQHPLLGLDFAILNTLFSQNAIHMASSSFVALLILMLSGFMYVFLRKQGLRYQVFAASATLFVVFISQILFEGANIALPLSAIILNTVILILWHDLSTHYLDRKERVKVENMFARYLTKEVMDELMDSPMWTEAGGRRVTVSVLFSDIRGFTSITESMDPKTVVEQLNEYLTVMTPVVFAHKGTIDKFVGDGIMAYFGAPLYPEQHAWRAVKAGMDMQKALHDLNHKWEREGKQPLNIGVGINTGPVIMGNIGTEQYMDFTLIGDSVNLASRLCSAAVANEVLISTSTYQEVFRNVVIDQSREILVKGKLKPVRVYGIRDLLRTEARDKRRYERFDISLPIRLKRDDNFGETAWLVDIGGGGFCCIASETWIQGETILSSLKLPNGIEIQSAKARIVHTDLIEEGLRIKAEFTEITEMDREEISKLARTYSDEGEFA